MNIADQPAFPIVGQNSVKSPGMTMRQYYAGKNMASIVAAFIPVESKYSVNGGYMAFDDMAVDAVKAADALIAELEKNQP